MSAKCQKRTLVAPEGLGSEKAIQPSNINDQPALGSRAANQYASCIWRVQRLLDVLDLTFGHLADTCMADARTAAVIGTQAVVLRQIQNTLARGIPRGCGASIRAGLLSRACGDNDENAHPNHASRLQEEERKSKRCDRVCLLYRYVDQSLTDPGTQDCDR